MIYVKQIQGPVGLGTNVAEGETWNKSSYPRSVARASLLGGLAIGDAELTIGYGTLKQMILRNFDTVTAIDSRQLYWNSSQMELPANTPLIGEVTQAFSASMYVLVLEVTKA